MSHFTRLAIAAGCFGAFALMSNAAAARERLYPLTLCGPDLAYLCPLHGSFDQVPFRYNLAIHPGCIKVMPVQTPNGVERRRVLVCG